MRSAGIGCFRIAQRLPEELLLLLAPPLYEPPLLLLPLYDEPDELLLYEELPELR